MIRIALVGILGFGRTHLSSIRECEKKGLCRLDSVVVADIESSRDALKEVRTESPDLRVYGSLTELIKKKDPVDLICLPTGIGSHKTLSVQSLDAGYNVLCEKPVAGTLEEGLAMAEAQAKSGKILAIGFQNIFSPSIQKIKSLALSGQLGDLKEARTIVAWPRNAGYYGRNRWAGKIEDSGVFIFDSPLQNGTAHFLHNMLYVSGETPDESCEIESVYGENYHFNPIPSADTQFIRVRTSRGAVLSMTVSHAVKNEIEPRTEYLFEKGRILWSNGGGKTRVYDCEGRTVQNFDNGRESPHLIVFEKTIAAVAEGRTPLSHIHNALAHTRCLEALFRCMNPVRTIRDEYGVIEKNKEPGGEDLWYINDLDRVLEESFKGGKSFAEMNLPWAVRGEILAVRG